MRKKYLHYVETCFDCPGISRCDTFCTEHPQGHNIPDPLEIPHWCPLPGDAELWSTGFGNIMPSPRAWFRGEWDKLNSKRGFSWDSNPWVWRIELEKRGTPTPA